MTGRSWAFENVRSYVDADGQEWWCIPEDLSDSVPELLRKVADDWEAANRDE